MTIMYMTGAIDEDPAQNRQTNPQQGLPAGLLIWGGQQGTSGGSNTPGISEHRGIRLCLSSHPTVMTDTDFAAENSDARSVGLWCGFGGIKDIDAPIAYLRNGRDPECAGPSFAFGFSADFIQPDRMYFPEDSTRLQ
jgi:hypothetical protein